jgi:hypothetical protein
MRDPEFFLQKYAPVSTSFSIVSASLDEVVNYWLKWHRGSERIQNPDSAF